MDNEWSEDSLCLEYGITKNDLVTALAGYVKIYGTMVRMLPKDKQNELINRYLENSKLATKSDSQLLSEYRYVLEFAAKSVKDFENTLRGKDA